MSPAKLSHRIFDRLSYSLMPRLNWVQLEVTSFCNARCIYCPRTVYGEDWQDRRLPLSTFKKLLSSSSKTGLLFLQGWGEPLMSPHFFEMVKLAKARRLGVGTTTNGTLINQDKATRLVETGMDILAFSLAGATTLNDRFRKGASIEKVVDAINLVKRAKEKTGSSTPDIHIAYLLLRSGMEDLHALPSLLSGLGVSQVVISTLDFVPDKALEQETIMPSTKEEFDGIKNLVQGISRECAGSGTAVHSQIFNPAARRITCTEMPREALFISSDGTVSPCVFNCLPAKKAGSRVMTNARDAAPGKWKEKATTGLQFGNINQAPLHRIWRKKDYAAFRNSFFNREVNPLCRECPKLYMG